MNEDDGLPRIRSDMDQLALLVKEWVPVYRSFYCALIDAGFSQSFAEQLVLEYAKSAWNDGDDEE